MSTKPESSQAGTCTGYTVQLRARSFPRQFGKQLVGTDWVNLPIVRTDDGVPNKIWNVIADEQGLQTHTAAIALMAWAAAADPWHGFLFRMVRHELKYSWTISTTGYGPVIDYDALQREAVFTESLPVKTEPA